MKEKIRKKTLRLGEGDGRGSVVRLLDIKKRREKIGGNIQLKKMEQ